MTETELKLWQKINKLMRRVGQLEGALMVVEYWDAPKELKEKIKITLKNDPIGENFLEDLKDR